METSDLLDSARVGFAGLDVAPSTQERALSHLEIWLNDPRFVPYHAQIMALAESNRWVTLLDSFYRVLPFGTGGRRGRVGVGPNRFNPWTFSTSVEGHARWLKTSLNQGPLSVVVGYDVRRFTDFSESLVPEVPSPVTGVSSRDFAEIAAEIYAAHEITVFMPQSADVLSTPELSFAVRDLNASGGLIISASHNPPDDNGSKFYHAHGGQLVPPFDQELAESIQDVDRIDRMSLDRGIANGLIRLLEPDIHARYVTQTIRSCPSMPRQPIPLVFTPLHGTAEDSVGDVLKAAGVPLTLEPSQTVRDGSFPTVPYRSPNPERPETLTKAIETADAQGACLVMGCDPDADRLGVAVRHQTKWVTLNGHEIAALVTHAVLLNHPHSEPVVMKTEVTSSLVSRIAEAKGARVVEDLLVGFKYIGHAMFMLERKGRFGSIEGDLDCFAVGVEESHGILVTPDTRDKDAAGGALILCQLASAEAAEGRTLVDTLNDLMESHGVFVHHQGNMVLDGASGRARINAIMQSLRTNPPKNVAQEPILEMTDRQDETGPDGPYMSETDKISRDQIAFKLPNDGRIAVRPSGTEPKLKIYIELYSEPDSDTEHIRFRLQQKMRNIHRHLLIEMLNRIDIHMPLWAFDIADTVNLDTKIEWSTQLMPTLLEKLETDTEEAKRWLHNTLDSGKRELFKPGVLSFIQRSGIPHPTLIDCFEEASEIRLAD